ncbi:ATP-binding protein [Parapedobacter deserti]|uniref:ATP-binding protein n=1 Tax=Parapedobacter deserti TaxID=1912957 RepID=UPI00366C6EE2
MTKFELIKDSQVTNAGFLLFAKNDVFQAAIELGRFSTPTSIKDGLTVRSDLFGEVEELLGFIRKHINKGYIITGDPQREERWQYPMPALREIVINMIVHRDYMSSGDSSVKIFDDYIEFFNPGHLPDTITIAQLLADEYSSYSHNRKVAATFKEAQLIETVREWRTASSPLKTSKADENYGSGIRRIREAFELYGLKTPKFENFQHGFRVIVYAETTTNIDKTTRKTVGKTAEIFDFIKSNPQITREQLADETGLSVRGVEYHLKILRETNRINRVGSKGGH